MLPGVIKVYKYGYEVAESLPIYFMPEGMDTIYRFIQMTPEQPVPPTPPSPPEPVPPVPPTPVNPDVPGGGIVQTGDVIPFGVIAVVAIVAALGCGIALRKEYF